MHMHVRSLALFLFFWTFLDVLHHLASSLCGTNRACAFPLLLRKHIYVKVVVKINFLRLGLLLSHKSADYCLMICHSSSCHPPVSSVRQSCLTDLQVVSHASPDPVTCTGLVYRYQLFPSWPGKAEILCELITQRAVAPSATLPRKKAWVVTDGMAAAGFTLHLRAKHQGPSGRKRTQPGWRKHWLLGNRLVSSSSINWSVHTWVFWCFTVHW